MTTTTEARKVPSRTYSRLPYSPLTGRGLADALVDAQIEWGVLSRHYPFACFPLDTMTERLKAHNAEHPDLWAASVRGSRLGDAIARRIDG